MPNDDPLLLDDSLWPLLLVQIRGAVPFARFEEYLVQRLASLERQQKHVVLFDMRNAPMLPAEHRHLQSEWLKQPGRCQRTRFGTSSPTSPLTPFL